jgi:hypothetical protein
VGALPGRLSTPAGLFARLGELNARTTAIAAADLLRFLEAEGHPPEFLDLAR